MYFFWMRANSTNTSDYSNVSILSNMLSVASINVDKYESIIQNDKYHVYTESVESSRCINTTEEIELLGEQFKKRDHCWWNAVEICWFFFQNFVDMYCFISINLISNRNTWFYPYKECIYGCTDLGTTRRSCATEFLGYSTYTTTTTCITSSVIFVSNKSLLRDWCLSCCL